MQAIGKPRRSLQPHFQDDFHQSPRGGGDRSLPGAQKPQGIERRVVSQFEI
jgi:hypothetical protein